MTEITKLTECIDTIPAWVVMWALAITVFIGLKLLMLAVYPGRLSTMRELAFLFLWPGMNPSPFADDAREMDAMTARLFPAVGMTLLGLLLMWMAPHIRPLGAGWFGMIGIVCTLHFGVFHLLALWWQGRGVPVQPLMDNPLIARSLADFWGNRWNRAFSDAAYRLLMRPLTRRFGRHVGVLTVFVFSGVVHELVISVPAGAGYGWPLGYFIFQGSAVTLEKSALGQRCGLGQGLRGRLFTMAVVVLPVFWLFHPPFMKQVIVPFINTIHHNAPNIMPTLETILYLAALVHFGILIASANAPKALNWKRNLRELPCMLRQLFWVYGVFIVVMIISFGVLTLVHAPAMAAGDPIARSICALIAIFWGLRLLVQWFVFDAKPFLTNRFYQVGYHLLTVAFVFLTGVYGATALRLWP